MAKEKLSDLNRHLFAQLERLGEEDLSGDDLKNEIQRSHAISKVSHQIVNNAALILKAQEMMNEYGDDSGEIKKMLDHEKF